MGLLLLQTHDESELTRWNPHSLFTHSYTHPRTQQTVLGLTTDAALKLPFFRHCTSISASSFTRFIDRPLACLLACLLACMHATHPPQHTHSHTHTHAYTHTHTPHTRPGVDRDGTGLEPRGQEVAGPVRSCVVVHSKDRDEMRRGAQPWRPFHHPSPTLTPNLNLTSDDPPHPNTPLHPLHRGWSIGISSGGVAEIFQTNHPDGHEVIMMKERKGFIKLALRTGVPVVPCFLYGNTKLMSCW
jgi:hypothetical protein